jgi:hypothetical protein
MSTQLLLIGGSRLGTANPPAAQNGTNLADQPAGVPVSGPQNTNSHASLKKDPLCT